MADRAVLRFGRPVGSGSGKRPEMRERADADLVAYCKEQQALNSGFLAGLVERHRIDLRD